MHALSILQITLLRKAVGCANYYCCWFAGGAVGFRMSSLFYGDWDAEQWIADVLAAFHVLLRM